MSGRWRLPDGGAIDRDRPCEFRFNGRRYFGCAGDTLASALAANGVRLVARSVRYHRPRGIVAAGTEEPNALVQLGRGARSVPNLKATEIELYDGLCARSVNVFPSVGTDFGAALGALSRFMPAGFYYKTFFASHRLWNRLFEPLIRRAGGWGRAPSAPDPDRYDRMHAHCDVLVVGAGAAGLAAARAAAAGGARVILADEQPAAGGSLLRRKVTVDGRPGAEWAAAAARELACLDNVTLLRRTTVTGYYDDNYLVALERRGHEAVPGTPGRSRQRLWHVRARRVILATGAHERLLVFANNDRPGVVLAGALQAWINRYAVLPGRDTVLFTNNDRAYETALDCRAAGGRVRAIVDARESPSGELVDAAREAGIDVLENSFVVDTRGRRGLKAVLVQGGAGGPVSRLRSDLLAVSGGWNPAVHLHSHAQGRLRWDDALCCFRPDGAPRGCASAGAANGCPGLDAGLAEAHAAGQDAAAACGLPAEATLAAPRAAEPAAGPPAPLWRVAGKAENRQFVDLQNDSSVADIRVAVREGFESVEHMKRYTLTGFGTDQGKISNVNGLAILAELTATPIAAIGTTTFRPPYTPVTFGAMGGRDRGELFEPARLTAMHAQHVAAGAVFEDVGQWKRPWYYPREGEDMRAAVARECGAVRAGVGMLDASTLGKIDIQGPDAALFLERVYTNHWRKLAIGRIRYGVMCHEDGMVFDDGTTARLAGQRYLMTTTTGGAAAVLDHLEEYLQTEWPELAVRLTSVTEQWSTLAIAGPKSRDVLAALAPGLDLTPEAFPFLAWRNATVAGLAARVFRISFTGELQFEINVPWHDGPALWTAVAEAGSEHGITPYGTETMHVLRAEKGFIIVGQETDGTQTPLDLGLDWAVSDRKDFIGRRSLARPDTHRSDRRQLVGLLPADPERFVPEGSQLVERDAAPGPPVPMLGYVTSSYWSPALGTHFCLALVDDGRRRHGDTIVAALTGDSVPLRIVPPVFYDPDSERRDG